MRRRVLQLYVKNRRADIFFSMEYHVYWKLKSSRFELFGDKKYGLFLSQEVDGKMIFTSYWEVLVLKFSVMGNTVFFQPKILWKDDIYLVFLSFPWYCRTWEIWFFVQCKCIGSCNNINSPCAKFCVPDVVKSLNVKVLNLVSGTNETRRIAWHEPCKCKCRFNSSVCNNKQRWNDDKCRCECEELIDKDVCDKGFIWNPSNCECECYKSCDFSDYLDYKNCKC